MRFDLAKALGDAALSSASQRGLPPLAIVILDTGAHVKFAATQDGAGPLRYPIALAKANAAIGMGMSTRQLFSLFEGELLPDRFSNAISSVATHGFAPQPGGELVMIDGLPVGAIGISGASSDQDEAIALAALQSVKQAFV